MGTDAIAMFLVGAVGLWGGLAAVVVNYQRASRNDPAD